MMFGIDDALIWMPLAGAVAGGLMNKKDPLKGALLGGAMGYGGGLLSPAAAGGAALDAGVAQGAAMANMGSGAVMDAAIASGANAANPMGWKQAGELIKPVGNVVNTAAAAKNLMSSPETPLPPIQASPVITGQNGQQSLNQIVQSNATKGQQLAMEAEQKKNRRIGLLNSFARA